MQTLRNEAAAASALPAAKRIGHPRASSRLGEPRVWGRGFKGFRVLGFRGSGFRVEGFRVWGLGSRLRVGFGDWVYRGLG